MVDEKKVRDALIKMVDVGRIENSILCKQSISEMTIIDGENTMYITWYPPHPHRPRSCLRSLSFNGTSSPLSDKYAEHVLNAALRKAEKVFERRAETILRAYPV